MASPHVLTRGRKYVGGGGRTPTMGNASASDFSSDDGGHSPVPTPPTPSRLTKSSGSGSNNTTRNGLLASPSTPLSARRNVRTPPAPLKMSMNLPPNLATVTPPQSANSLRRGCARSSPVGDLLSPTSASAASSSVFPSRSLSSRRGSAGRSSVASSSPAFAPSPSKISPRSPRRIDSGHDGGDSRRASSLMPRSPVVTNYFNLDFSFLEDEPPKSATGSSISERRRSSGGSNGSLFPSRERRSSNSTNGSRRRESYISNGPNDVSAYASRSPFHTSFAASGSRSSMSYSSKRPNNPRTISADSTDSTSSDRERSYLSRIDSLLPAGQIKDYRRPSEVSYTSLESNNTSTSSEPSSLGIGMRATLSTSDVDGSPTKPAFTAVEMLQPDIDDQSLNVVERRKRLANFLDQTASAMEGGRTLRQVLPETAPARAGEGPAKSLSQLAEISASSPSIGRHSPMSNRTPMVRPSSRASAKSDVPSDQLPGAFNPSPVTRVPRIPKEHENTMSFDQRATIFFTPETADSFAKSQGQQEEEEDEEARYVKEPLGTGLGLQAPTQQHERSPSTLHASTPVASPRTPDSVRLTGVALDVTPRLDDGSFGIPEIHREQAARAKMAEKRRRTIQELIDTEQSYATDMVVVRDIYLARARGADFNTIADHVMASGLGLSAAASPSSPSRRGSGFSSPTMSSRSEARRLTMNSLSLNSSAGYNEGRRVSSAPSFSAKLEQRRATKARLSSVSSFSSPGAPVMSSKDIHVVFANLEEVAGLAQRFAHLLSQTKGSADADGVDEMDRNVGEIFINIIPQIQRVYSTYCARHHRAIVRLQELEGSLRNYLAECRTLSHGRTNAWDLASLLIKPVQRCLKYPLLLDQILAVTPEDHPDRHHLVRANSDMLLVAEHINESKKYQGPQDRVTSTAASLARKESKDRRESKSSLSSAMTKKFLRSSISAKSSKPAPITTEQAAERDDMFDTLAALVDSTRSAVLRFSSEMRDWSKATKARLEAQVAVVEGWIDLYAPVSEEPDSQDSLFHRLIVFLEQVLDPVIDGPYREVEYEIRRSLLLKSDHLLSLFESPRQFTQKRNDKMLDHSRYLAKKLPGDRRGSEEYLELSARLLEELPRFLASVSKYYDIIVGHFAGAQEAYQEEVQERWDAFAARFPLREGVIGGQRVLADELMHRLAIGLGIVTSLPPSSSRKRFNRPASTGHQSSSSSGSPLRDHPMPRRESIMVVDSPLASSTVSNPMSASASVIRTRLNEYQLPSLSSSNANDHAAVANRSSVTSDSSTPSFTVSSKSGDSSNGTPATPPPFVAVSKVGEDYYTKRRQSLHQRSLSNLSPIEAVTLSPNSKLVERASASVLGSAMPSPLQTPPFSVRSNSGDETSSSSITATRPSPSPVPTPVRQSSRDREREAVVHIGSALNDDDDEDQLNLEQYYYEEDKTLYVAEAMEDSIVQRGSVRGAFPLLDFKCGDRIDVEHEEADHAEGGCGWLLGKKQNGGLLGWVRTEQFSMLEEDEPEG